MAANVGSIFISLDADLNKFVQDFNRAAAATEDFGARAGKTVDASKTLGAAISDELTSKMQKAAGGAGALGSVLTKLGPVGLAAAAGIGGISLALVEATKHADEFAAKAQKIIDFGDTVGLTAVQVQALGADSKDTATFIENFARGMDALRQGGGPLLDSIRRISPALADQMASTKDTATALDLLARAYQKAKDAGDTFQALALRKAAGGRIGGDVLDSITNGGGVDALTASAKRAGQALDDELLKRIAKLRSDIDDLKSSSGNIFDAMFSEKVLTAEKAFFDTYHAGMQMIRDGGVTGGLSTFTSLLNNKYANGYSGSVGEAYRLQQGLMRTGGNRLAEMEADTGKPSTRIDVSKAPDAAGTQTPAFQLTSYQHIASALGNAITPAEQLKLKQLQLNAAMADGTIKADVAARAIDAERQSMVAAATAARQRLGIASEEEIQAVRLADINKQAADGYIKNEQEKALAVSIAQKESHDAYNSMLIRGSSTPGLTQLSLDSQNLTKQLDQGLSSALRDSTSDLIDMAKGTETAAQGLTNLALKFTEAIAQAVLMKSVIGPISGAISGFLPGVTGGATGAPLSLGTIGGTAGGLAAVHHAGGVVGSGSAPMRHVSSGLFAGAPRFHGGLPLAERSLQPLE